MRHAKHKYKLGIEPSHRKAMIRNLAVEIIEKLKQLKLERKRLREL